MNIELAPLLQVERSLYHLPRGRERFERYIEVMTGGGSDMLAPLTLLNPMGKEHVASSLDRLIAMDAEKIAAAALIEARRRFAGLPGDLRVALVVADDTGGGWTDRYLTEVKQRFENDYEPKRGWAVALFWTGEMPSAALIRGEALGAVFRACWIQRRGLPRTLGQMMEQEGLAARFAGSVPPSLNTEELARVGAVIDSRRGSPRLPVQFACLYGDDAARSAGYPALGLPPRAGFAVALHEAASRRGAPEDLLIDAQAVGPHSRSS